MTAKHQLCIYVLNWWSVAHMIRGNDWPLLIELCCPDMDSAIGLEIHLSSPSNIESILGRSTE